MIFFYHPVDFSLF